MFFPLSPSKSLPGIVWQGEITCMMMCKGGKVQKQAGRGDVIGRVVEVWTFGVDKKGQHNFQAKFCINSSHHSAISLAIEAIIESC